jgi:hypothetical protein
MNNNEATATQARSEQAPDETIAVLTSNGSGEHTEPEEAAEAPEVINQTGEITDEPEAKVEVEAVTNEPTVKTESAAEVKLESVEGADNLPIIAQIPNPLFGRTGSAHIKEEDYDSKDFQILTTPPPKRSSRASNRVLSNKPKNVRARARKAAKEGELAVIAAKCKTKLPKRAGVVVDCAIMAKDGCAVVSTPSLT